MECKREAVDSDNRLALRHRHQDGRKSAQLMSRYRSCFWCSLGTDDSSCIVLHENNRFAVGVHRRRDSRRSAGGAALDLVLIPVFATVLLVSAVKLTWHALNELPTSGLGTGVRRAAWAAGLGARLPRLWTAQRLGGVDQPTGLPSDRMRASGYCREFDKLCLYQVCIGEGRLLALEYSTFPERPGLYFRYDFVDCWRVRLVVYHVMNC